VGNFALLALIQSAPFALPAAYLDLLRASNGGVGGLLGGAFYLTPAEQVLVDHRGWGVDELAPEHLLIGSDGHGSFFLLDEAGRVRRCRSVEVSTPALWRLVFQSCAELVGALVPAPPLDPDP
jgi:hypothetical protein